MIEINREIKYSINLKKSYIKKKRKMLRKSILGLSRICIILTTKFTLINDLFILS